MNVQNFCRLILAVRRRRSVTPNGINMANLTDIPGKTREDEQWINAGAVLRVAPIKDVKTMIQAFAFAKEKVPNLKLWIMTNG